MMPCEWALTAQRTSGTSLFSGLLIVKIVPQSGRLSKLYPREKRGERVRTVAYTKSTNEHHAPSPGFRRQKPAPASGRGRRAAPLRTRCRAVRPGDPIVRKSGRAGWNLTVSIRRVGDPPGHPAPLRTGRTRRRPRLWSRRVTRRPFRILL